MQPSELNEISQLISDTMVFVGDYDSQVFAKEPKKVLLFGPPGSGKSTLVDYLLSDFQAQEDLENAQARKQSDAFYPRFLKDKLSNIVYCDCLGFKDPKIISGEIITSIVSKKIAESSEKIKLLLVLDFEAINSSSENSLTSLLRSLKSLFKNLSEFKDSATLCVNGIDRSQNTSSVGDCLKSLLQSLSSQDDQVIVDFLDHMVKNNRFVCFYKPKQNEAIKDEDRQSIIDCIKASNFSLICPSDVNVLVSTKSKSRLQEFTNSVMDNFQQSCRSLSKEVISLWSQYIQEVKDYEERKSETEEFLKAIEGMRNTFESLASNTRNLLMKYNLQLNCETLNEVIRSTNSFEFLQQYFAQQDLNFDEEQIKRLVAASFDSLKDYLKQLKGWYDLLTLGIYPKLSQYEIQRNKSEVIATLFDKDFESLLQISKGEKIITKERFENFFNSLYKLDSQFFINQNLDLLSYANSPLNHHLVSQYQDELQDVVQYLFDKLDPSIDETNSNLTISSRFPCLSQVRNYIKEKNFQKIQSLTIIGFDTVFLDDDLTFPSSNLSIIAPKWSSCKKIVIDLQGKDNTNEPKKVGYDINNNGLPGECGENGESSGNFSGLCAEFLNFTGNVEDYVTFRLDGGKGGAGGSGGNGHDGASGENANGSDFKVSNQSTYDEFRKNLIIEDGRKVCHRYRKYGKQGTKGGDGGQGAEGGYGGREGYAQIIISNRQPYMLSGKEGRRGDHGKSGTPGQGGYPGFDFVCDYPFPTERRKALRSQFSRAPSGKVQNNIITLSQKSAPLPTPVPFDFMKGVGLFTQLTANKTKTNLKRKLCQNFVVQIQENPNFATKDSTDALLQDYLDIQKSLPNIQESFDLERYFRSLLTRIKNYAAQGNNQNFPTLNYLYSSVLSSILALRAESETILVTDLKQFFKTINETIAKLKDQDKIAANNFYKKQAAARIHDKIDEAQTLIPKLSADIKQNLKNIEAQIKLLLDEIEELRKKGEGYLKEINKKKKELRNLMQLKAIFGVFDILCQGAALLGPEGKVAGAIVGAGLKFVKPFVVKEVDSTPPKLQIPAGVYQDLAPIKEKSAILRMRSAIHDPQQHQGLSIDTELKYRMELLDEDFGSKFKELQQQNPKLFAQLEASGSDESKGPSDIEKALASLEMKEYVKTYKEYKEEKLEAKKAIQELAKAKKEVEEKKQGKKEEKPSDPVKKDEKDKPSDSVPAKKDEKEKPSDEKEEEKKESEEDKLKKKDEKEKPSDEKKESEEDKFKKKDEKEKPSDEKKESEEDKLKKKVEKLETVVGMLDTGIAMFNEYQADSRKMDELTQAYKDIQGQLGQLNEFRTSVVNFYSNSVGKFADDVSQIQENLAGNSQALLDVKKLEIKKYLSSFKAQLASITEGFKVQGELQRIVDEIGDIMNTLITVYDRIETFSDQAELVNFLGYLSSNSMLDTQLGTYKEKVDQVKFYILQNRLAEQYELALKTFKQWIFPYDYQQIIYEDLPRASSDLENVAKMIQKLNDFSIVIADYATNKRDRSIMRSEFDTNYQSTFPFYTWRGRENAKLFEDFFRGSEILLFADVNKTMIVGSAIKFNEIELKISFENAAENDVTRKDSDFKKLNDELKNWTMKMTHLGDSYYTYQGKTHKISTKPLMILYNFEKNAAGGAIAEGQEYIKMKKGDYLISPFASWKLKLQPGQGLKKNPDAFANFRGLIPLVKKLRFDLVGKGIYTDESLMANKKTDSRPLKAASMSTRSNGVVGNNKYTLPEENSYQTSAA